MRKGFFAYGSTPNSSGESVLRAVEEINKAQNISIKPWIKMQNDGKIIINQVLKEIDTADFICADLTGMNENVLFEIGYAIAKEKPLYLIFDTTLVESKRLYDELGLLSNVGYHKYANSAGIVKGFYEFYSEITKDESEGTLESLIKSIKVNKANSALFYIKSQVITEYTKSISNIINKLPTIIDDAYESKVDTLRWYIEQLMACPALLVEFSSKLRSGYQLQNAKCSLISGLGLGLDKKVLMVCEKPHDTPLDLKELLIKYTTVSECEKVIIPFVEDLNNRIAELLLKTQQKKKAQRKRSELQKIDFGEIVAEHENDLLPEYYIETSHLESLVKNEYNLIVGRKGTGKTASLIFLNESLSSDTRKFVCLIKPINFEIDGLTSLLEQMPEDYERSFLIESVWKFLIYTEIARMLYLHVKNKPLYAKVEIDEEYEKFIENDEKLYLGDLSLRLDEQLNQLDEFYSSSTPDQKQFKVKVSELLHVQTFNTLKKYFADLIEDRNEIIVLIDNLDKSWRKTNKINLISKTILGLLSVSGRLAKEISIIKSRSKTIKFRLVVFLRSDIFKYVLKFAREPDKLEYTKLQWNDPEAFFRIIEERFVRLNDNAVDVVEPTDLWDKYITDSVKGHEVHKYIMDRVYPRPRDVIFFFKKAQEKAILRGHEKILESDLIDAYKDYSTWVFTSLIVENGISYKQMEDFLYSLIGSTKIVDKDYISRCMNEAGIDTAEEKTTNFIDHLISMTIIGREIGNNNFVFEHDFDASKKHQIMADKLHTMRYKIHPALYPYLEIPE